MLPEAIGRFRVLRRIGAGGMGIVYEAEDPRDGRRVALKVLLPHAAEQTDGLDRFKQEFRALARLRHPHIVEVHDAGIEDDVPFIVMEYVAGRNLRQYLRALPEGPVRERELVRCLRQLSAALAFIHARRILHRDLKPENILVTDDGRVKLMDFGVARVIRTEGAEDGLLGTFAYMAPEQVRGEEVDGRTDLYAVGMLIYELLVGDYPFPIEPPAAALHHHVNTVPDPIGAHVPLSDRRLGELAARLLQKAPHRRLPSAEAVYAFLGASERPADEGRRLTASFHGRARPMARLEHLAEGLEVGRGHLVVVEGPPGIGKSRLLRELAERAGRPAVQVGAAAEPGRAFGVFELVFESVAAWLDGAEPALRHRILDRDGAPLAAISPGFARLVGAHEDAAPDPRGIRRAAAAVLGRLALSQPFLLLLDDAEAMDEASAQLVRDLARTLLIPRPKDTAGRTVAPVLMVLTRGPSEASRSPLDGALQRLEPGVRRVDLALEPLDMEATAAFAAELLGARSLDGGLSERLLRATGGRPDLVEAVVQAWTREGVLQERDGRWGLGEASDEVRTRRPKPPSGDELLLARVEGMEPQAQELLEWSALLGRVIPGELLSAVAPMSEPALLDAIDALVRGQVLEEEVRGDRVHYRFAQDGLREFLVRRLPPARRRALHGQLARALEAHFRRGRRGLAHALARHHRASEHPERAGRPLMWAARDVAARGDIDGAIRRLQEARRVYGSATGPQRRRAARALALEMDLLLEAGRPGEVVRLAATPETAVLRGQERLRSRLDLRLAGAWLDRGAPDRAQALLEPRRLRRLEGAEPILASHLCARWAEATGRIEEAARAFRVCAEQARAAGERARAAAFEAEADRVAGEAMNPEGLERIADATEDPELASWLHGLAGLGWSAQGDEVGARASLEAALELAEQRSLPRQRLRWMEALTLNLAAAGYRSESRTLSRATLELATEIEDAAALSRLRPPS